MSWASDSLSELLRPQRIDDLSLPQSDIGRLQNMVAGGALMNMLFYGGSGIGKTSAGRILIKALGPEDSIEIDGSNATGVDFIRERIEPFAKAVSLFGGRKICFIDEADYMSRNAQAAIRKVIEDYSDNCRFLLAVNDITKLIPAIRSRLLRVSFDIPLAERPQVQARLLDRYERILWGLKIAYDKSRLIQLLTLYFPDLRAIANRVEYEFVLPGAINAEPMLHRP